MIYTVITYNRFVKLRAKIQEAEAGIDAALTKRFDLLTKELAAVKGYVKHERELNTELTRIRAGMSLNEKQNAASGIEKAHTDVKLLAEGYPDLKASENFKQLQLSIADAEEHLQAARRAYNSNVSMNNSLINSFPSKIVAKIFKFQEYGFFTAEEEKRGDVEIKFD